MHLTGEEKICLRNKRQTRQRADEGGEREGKREERASASESRPKYGEEVSKYFAGRRKEKRRKKKKIHGAGMEAAAGQVLGNLACGLVLELGRDAGCLRKACQRHHGYIGRGLGGTNAPLTGGGAGYLPLPGATWP